MNTKSVTTAVSFVCLFAFAACGNDTKDPERSQDAGGGGNGPTAVQLAHAEQIKTALNGCGDCPSGMGGEPTCGSGQVITGIDVWDNAPTGGISGIRIVCSDLKLLMQSENVVVLGHANPILGQVFGTDMIGARGELRCTGGSVLTAAFSTGNALNGANPLLMKSVGIECTPLNLSGAGSGIAVNYGMNASSPSFGPGGGADNNRFDPCDDPSGVPGQPAVAVGMRVAAGANSVGLVATNCSKVELVF